MLKIPNHTPSLSFPLQYVLKVYILCYTVCTSLYLGRIMNASDTRLLFKGPVMLAKSNTSNSSKPYHDTIYIDREGTSFIILLGSSGLHCPDNITSPFDDNCMCVVHCNITVKASDLITNSRLQCIDRLFHSMHTIWERIVEKISPNWWRW